MVKNSHKFWDSVTWFKPSEWKKDPGKASQQLVLTVDKIRSLTLNLKPGGIPIHIHVCWNNEGHSEGSYHYSGQAVDLHFGSGLLPLDELLLILSISGIGGVGYYPEWKPRPGWHLDRRPYDNGRLFWTYRKSYGYDYSLATLTRELHLTTNQLHMEELCLQLKKAFR